MQDKKYKPQSDDFVNGLSKWLTFICYLINYIRISKVTLKEMKHTFTYIIIFIYVIITLLYVLGCINLFRYF